jgi:hypothetical protein
MIRIDDEVYEYLNQRGHTEDTFNDVLRRELGLGQKKSSKGGTRSVSGSAGTTTQEHLNASRLTPLLDKHLPSHWGDTRARRDQILQVVEAFLNTPREWTTAEREVYAAKLVAKSLRVEVNTVQDKCTRQLFGNGTVMQHFHAALMVIESEWEKTNN